jgi:RHS repeat-associated protein
MKDAGGVGALLQIRDHASGKDYFPSYDGNGNIAALLDADSSTGAVAAAYEYSPYGEFLRCEGPYAKENPFRFSTKFTDDETGLVYYGRRYYSSSQGRFLGRDPIKEAGGLNLYGFVSNNPINRWDLLGMEPDWTPESDTDEDVEDRPLPNGMVQRITWRGSPDLSSESGSFVWKAVGEVIIMAPVAADPNDVTHDPSIFPNNGTSSSRAGSFAAGTFLLAGVMVADDATVIGIANDPAIPFVVGGGLLIAGGLWVYDQLNPPLPSQVNSDKSTESKPTNAPPGTRPIDQSGLPRDAVHGIKDGIGAGPKDWTGIAPNGDVITTGPDGKAINHGPKDSYLPGGGG